MINEFLKNWSGLAIGVTGVVISLIVFFYNRKKDRFNSLFEVFKYLNEDRHREARRVLYTQDNEKIKKEDRILSSHIILGFDAISESYPLIRVCEDIVRDDLTHMGSMLRYKLVPETEFLERYCDAVLRSVEKLNRNIKKRRKVRKNVDYLRNIDYLIAAANEYKDKHKQKNTDYIQNSHGEPAKLVESDAESSSPENGKEIIGAPIKLVD